MVILSARAERQVDRLLLHDLAQDRQEAADRLIRAVAAALVAASRADLLTRPLPAVHLELASRQLDWFEIHRDWFALQPASPQTLIVGVFYDCGNIARRIDSPLDHP